MYVQSDIYNYWQEWNQGCKVYKYSAFNGLDFTL